MASVAVAGRIAFVGVAATSTGVLAEIGEVRNWSVDVTQNQIDVTSNDSSGWVENIAGIRGFTMSWDAIYARTDAEQVLLRKSLSSGTIRFFSIRPTTASAALWSGNGFVESYKVSGAYTDATLHSMVIRGTRSLTASS